MKTTKAFLLILCLALLFVSLFGCTPKTALKPDEFTSIMHKSGLTVTDITAETDSSGFATIVLIASNSNFEIEYSQLLNAQTGEMIYEYNKEEFIKEHPVRMLSYETNAGNLNCFYFQAGGNFHIISQIGNTLLYCEADEACKSEILDLFKTLRYK